MIMRPMIHARWLVLVLALVAVAVAQAGTRLDLIAFGDWGAPLTDKSAPKAGAPGIEAGLGRAPTLASLESRPPSSGSRAAKPTSTRLAYQRAVARAMAGWMKERQVRPQAAVLLGDNFYGLLKSAEDSRFRVNFTEMYPRDEFPFPFYFALGNHDYEDGEHSNWKHQMDWKGDDRWRAPSATPGATWMRVDLPPEEPLLSLFVINNTVDGVNRRGRASGYLGWSDEVAWVAAELARPRRAPWLAAGSHYPPYSNGAHHKDDGPRPATGPWFNDRPSWELTRRDLLPLFHKAGIDFWLGGHDHNLQHLTSPEWPGLDILVSGAGGGTHPYGRHPLAPKEPLLIKGAGWLHMRFTRETAEVTFWHVKGLGVGKPGGTVEAAGHFVRRR